MRPTNTPGAERWPDEKAACFLAWRKYDMHAYSMPVTSCLANQKVLDDFECFFAVYRLTGKCLPNAVVQT